MELERKKLTEQIIQTVTYCKYGHPLTGDNLLIRKEGWRNCRKCRDFRSYEYRTKHSPRIDKYANIRKLIEASKYQKLFGQVTERRTSID